MSEEPQTGCVGPGDQVCPAADGLHTFEQVLLAMSFTVSPVVRKGIIPTFHRTLKLWVPDSDRPELGKAEQGPGVVSLKPTPGSNCMGRGARGRGRDSECPASRQGCVRLRAPVCLWSAGQWPPEAFMSSSQEPVKVTSHEKGSLRVRQRILRWGCSPGLSGRALNTTPSGLRRGRQKEVFPGRRRWCEDIGERSEDAPLVPLKVDEGAMGREWGPREPKGKEPDAWF